MGAAALVVAALSGCGATQEAVAGSNHPVIRSLDSSWVPGQLSLAQLAAYQAISEPALRLAQERFQLRKRELALLEARKIAKRKHDQEEARRKYREALRRARLAYQAALRKAAIERARQLRLIAAQKREIERQRRENERRRRVAPGEECRDPQQRQTYRCSTGHLPLLPTPKK
ncbi:MAG: hypothetical protein QOJ97_2397 [Solirubrobacteraceae bacterium]|jgi:hypothetical protein|nr:hypothetical protein [Solirubrobacteraceae bacterium]